jgi:hypothetical protein
VDAPVPVVGSVVQRGCGDGDNVDGEWID